MKTILFIIALMIVSFVIIDIMIKKDLEKSCENINSLILDLINISNNDIEIFKNEINKNLSNKDSTLEDILIEKQDTQYICSYKLKDYYKLASIKLYIGN